MLAIMRDYSQTQFQGTSGLFGAPWSAAWKMLRLSVAWFLYGPLVWIWGVLFLRRRHFSEGRRMKLIFLALAFLPYFLFCTFVHVGDPDQALGGVAILCVAGGAVLSTVLERFRSRRVWTTATLAVAAHCVLFFCPPYHAARASSYGFVREVDAMMASAIDGIADAGRGEPFTIIHWGSPVTSRQIEYYFPNAYTVVLPGSPDRAAPGEGPMVFHHHATIPLPAGVSGLIHPGSRRIVAILPARNAGILPGWTRHGPLFVLDAIPDAGITLGEHRILWEKR